MIAGGWGSGRGAQVVTGSLPEVTEHSGTRRRGQGCR